MFSTNPIVLKNKINTSDEVNCPIHNTLLHKKEINIRECDECYECIQDDRPFNYGRKNKGECSCKWYDKNVIEITCYQCIEDQIREKQKQDADEKEHEYMLFLGKWNSGIKGKLSCYGLKKLQNLAKIKKFKGYSKLSKEQLIMQLEKVVNDKDFPIH
jgi:hypothetical protein